MTPDRHGEPLIITIQSDMKALHITLLLIERLGTRTGMPRHNNCLTSKGEQSKADLCSSLKQWPFSCQPAMKALAVSNQPCLCMGHLSSLPLCFWVTVSRDLKGSYGEKSLPTDDALVEQALNGRKTGKKLLLLLLLSLLQHRCPSSDGDVPY